MNRRRKIFLFWLGSLLRLPGQEWSPDQGGGFVFEEYEVIGEPLESAEEEREVEVEREVEEEVVVVKVEKVVKDEVVNEDLGEEILEKKEVVLPGASSTLLAGEELQRALRSTLGETLAGEPGVSGSSFSPAVSRPIIRGLDGFRVATLLDGLGTLDLSQESPDHGVALDTALADGIEIYRGPSALRFGGGAIGGAVNTTTRLRPTLTPDGAAGGSIDTGFWSQNEGFQVGARGWAGWKGAAVSVYAGERWSGDVSIAGKAWSETYEQFFNPTVVSAEGLMEVENPDGVLPHSFHNSSTRSVGLSLGSEDGPVELGFSFAQFGAEYGIPYLFSLSPADDFGVTTIITELNRLDGELQIRPEESWGPITGISLRAAGGWYEHEELFQGRGPDRGLEYAEVIFDKQAIEARLEVRNGAEDSRLQGVSGIHFMQDQVDAQRLIFPSSLLYEDFFLEGETIGLFTVQKLSVGDWSLEAGVRAEDGMASVSQQDELIAREETRALSRSLALDWDSKVDSEVVPWVKTLGATLTASWSERAPSAVERFAFWENAALGSFVIGGDWDGVPLENEEALNLELTLRGSWNGGEARVSFYETHFENFIFLETLRGIGLEPTSQYVDREARIRGVEGEVRFSLWDDKLGERGLDLRVTGDWIQGQDLSRDQELYRMPAPKLGATLSWQSPGWNLYVEVRRSFGSGNTPLLPGEEVITEFRSDLYTLINAGVTWRPKEGESPIEVSLRGLNLLDEEIREHTSFRKDTSPQPGRGMSVEVKWEF